MKNAAQITIGLYLGIEIDDKFCIVNMKNLCVGLKKIKM